jgi:hypothetical protein
MISTMLTIVLKDNSPLRDDPTVIHWLEEVNRIMSQPVVQDRINRMREQLMATGTVTVTI